MLDALLHYVNIFVNFHYLCFHLISQVGLTLASGSRRASLIPADGHRWLFSSCCVGKLLRQSKLPKSANSACWLLSWGSLEPAKTSVLQDSLNIKISMWFLFRKHILSKKNHDQWPLITGQEIWSVDPPHGFDLLMFIVQRLVSKARRDVHLEQQPP